GPVPDPVEAIPLGRARRVREGDDVTVVSLGVGVHRALEAAAALEGDIDLEVLDLRGSR
ncbi:MAG: alpha-ketoacid dehydrogenase subunit beta, partial [Gemmatimonadetes bacterium]|nr:alpha-ketoacid dehydrogenase subunit beta [Gemmatimonadota bacterium]NIQ59834.1 alpha-ketoacid dehydrogenase subunit beta [Gemmatimonadota bacterium]NIU80037.1 alpha-ketoacid dehydrogenase subunit beta [Gammaproteobacteria bacterium]NIX41283.1 alpha-ketoacid dehydrogenase subunit beta [Gemmatimonadota bacterium]NIX48470.1 alpha-ketoacid dehydrogenase subunit beta [Gemmatimonadota bacterium]